ncbi:hypothetical protein TorRG33x02_256030 [Trema orientale]|uniref:Uncharacterized protein n=1 Tax=Trema orientale TaxID=63057 RepID=A0A2P5DBL1_TREOI|nr:hypothetical protein TorRG33x02_256030 [Trema orientale]
MNLETHHIPEENPAPDGKTQMMVTHVNPNTTNANASTTNSVVFVQEEREYVNHQLLSIQIQSLEQPRLLIWQISLKVPHGPMGPQLRRLEGDMKNITVAEPLGELVTNNGTNPQLQTSSDEVIGAQSDPSQYSKDAWDISTLLISKPRKCGSMVYMDKWVLGLEKLPTGDEDKKHEEGTEEQGTLWFVPTRQTKELRRVRTALASESVSAYGQPASNQRQSMLREASTKTFVDAAVSNGRGTVAVVVHGEYQRVLHLEASSFSRRTCDRARN